MTKRKKGKCVICGEIKETERTELIIEEENTHKFYYICDACYKIICQYETFMKKRYRQYYFYARLARTATTPQTEKRALDLLLEVIIQTCIDSSGIIDTRCISAFQDACAFLEEKRLLKKINPRCYLIRET